MYNTTYYVSYEITVVTNKNESYTMFLQTLVDRMVTRSFLTSTGPQTTTGAFTSKVNPLPLGVTNSKLFLTKVARYEKYINYGPVFFSFLQ